MVDLGSPVFSDVTEKYTFQNTGNSVSGLKLDVYSDSMSHGTQEGINWESFPRDAMVLPSLW